MLGHGGNWQRRLSASAVYDLSGLSFPPPEDLPNPGIEPKSPALAGEFFTTEPPMTSYDSEKQLSNAH